METTTKAGKIAIRYPRVPGLAPTVEAYADTMPEAEAIARERTAHRRDLRCQDVTIEVGGRTVRYCGPTR